MAKAVASVDKLADTRPGVVRANGSFTSLWSALVASMTGFLRFLSYHCVRSIVFGVIATTVLP